MKKYRQINGRERDEIASLVAKSRKISEIAKETGRHKSTRSRGYFYPLPVY